MRRRSSLQSLLKGSFIKKSGELDLLLLFSSIILHYWKSIEFERSRHFCAFLCDFLRRTFNFIIKWPIHFHNGGIVIDPSNCFFCHKSSFGNGNAFKIKVHFGKRWSKKCFLKVLNPRNTIYTRTIRNQIRIISKGASNSKCTLFSPHSNFQCLLGNQFL